MPGKDPKEEIDIVLAIQNKSFMVAYITEELLPLKFSSLFDLNYFLNNIQLLRKGSIDIFYCDNFEIRSDGENYCLDLYSRKEVITEDEISNLYLFLVKERKKKINK